MITLLKWQPQLHYYNGWGIILCCKNKLYKYSFGGTIVCIVASLAKNISKSQPLVLVNVNLFRNKVFVDSVKVRVETESYLS
jgi:hypothetical protein